MFCEGTAMSKQKNEGEGNKTAARHYNQKSQAFAKSGRVKDAAQQAAQAMDGDEREALERARREAASHAKEHDPDEQRNYRK